MSCENPIGHSDSLGFAIHDSCMRITQRGETHTFPYTPPATKSSNAPISCHEELNLEGKSSTGPLNYPYSSHAKGWPDLPYTSIPPHNLLTIPSCSSAVSPSSLPPLFPPPLSPSSLPRLSSSPSPPPPLPPSSLPHLSPSPLLLFPFSLLSPSSPSSTSSFPLPTTYSSPLPPSPRCTAYLWNI